MIVLAMIVDIVQYMPEIVDPMIVVRTTSISKIVMSMRKEAFSLAPMGVLAPRSAHARPSAQPPINMSRNFPAPVSAELSSNISPNPSEVISKVSEL